MLGGRSATHFCYPSGDYSRDFLPWLRQLGIRSATTCVPGLASDFSFDAWLDGTAVLLPRRRAWRLDPTRS